MDSDPRQPPSHVALATALAICVRLEAYERDSPKARAASLIARHVIAKARRRSLDVPGSAQRHGARGEARERSRGERKST